MSPRPVLAQFIALILVVSPAFMAGGPPDTILAILYGIAGLLLLLFPPKVAIPRSFAWAALLLVGAGALSFLPAHFFGVPSWRAAFQAHPDISLGSLATPQPWHTVEGLGMLIAGVILGLFLLCQPVDRRAHRRLAAAFALAIGAFAALAIYAAETGWSHPWDKIGTFGFLPNRNHVGTLLLMGGIAGAGPFLDGFARRRWIYVISLGVALGVVMLALLNYNGSRAGAVLFFVGSFLWMAGSFRQNVDRRIMISAILLFLFILGIFVTSRAEAWKRLEKMATAPTPAPTELQNTTFDPALASSAAAQSAETLSFDIRLLIYRDTLRMIADNPITGVGLGNFRYIFPRYRQESLSERFCLHPESSWLQLAAEAGVLAIIAAAALAVLAVLRLRGCSDYPGWTVRWASATAVLMFLLHCVIDVPGHRTATLWPALFLAGLAFRVPSNLKVDPKKKPWASRCLFVVSGIALLCAAAWLGGIIPHASRGPATIEAEKARFQAHDLYKQNQREEAIDVLKAALVRTPLAYGLYNLWGNLELTFAETDQTVDSLYADERILEPCFTNTAIQQATTWLPVDPTRSLQLFAEAMARAEKQKQWKHGVKSTYIRILQASTAVPGVADRLLPLAGDKPELLLVWMRFASPEALGQAISTLIARDPTLASWSDADRRLFLRLWHQRGDDEALMQNLEAQPAWYEAGWPLIAGRLARQQKYQEAWLVVAEKVHLTEPPSADGASHSNITDISRLRAWFAEQKTRAAALRLAMALFENGDFEEVVMTAKEADLRSCQSAKLSRLASLSAARINHWGDAWNYAISVINRENRRDIPE